jgi:site-specific recombinase XerD
MQTINWESYPLLAHNTLTRTFLEELAQLQRSPSTLNNYSRDLEDFLQGLVEVPFSSVLEADETLIARYIDGLWNRPARRGSGHKRSKGRAWQEKGADQLCAIGSLDPKREPIC